MRSRSFLLLHVAMTSLAIIACGGGETAAPTASAEVPTSAATPAATTSDASELAPGKVVRSADGALSIRSSGGVALQITLKRLTSPPAAPTGWTILDGAYDITARDRERAVTKLDSTIELSFRTPGGQAVVMFHDGTQWVIVESERAADGSLVAKTDHLTPYAVAQPKTGSSPKQTSGFTPPSVTPAASRTPVSVPADGASRTVEAPTALPSTTAVSRPSELPSPAATIGTAVGLVTPGATLTALARGTPVATPALLAGSEGEAKSALEATVAKFKGRKALATNASSYSGTIIGSITSTMYYGLYGGVNEVVTNGPTTSAMTGSYAFLSEPKTVMPANSTDAQSQLAAIFPGATGVKYKPVQESAMSYIYLYQIATTYATIGFSLVNGVPIAYMAWGTGSYAQAAEQVSYLQ